MRPLDKRIGPAGNRTDSKVVGDDIPSVAENQVRACRTKGCPGRMRGNVPCPVCRHYPRGFHSAQRLFWDGGETVRAGRRGKRAPATTGVDEAEVERLEADLARAIDEVRRTWRSGRWSG